MLHQRKLNAADVFTGDLGQVGSWVVACVEPRFSWPTSVQRINYCDQTFFVVPQVDDYYPSIAVRLGGSLATFRQGQELILNLLSAMAWVESKGALVDQWIGGSHAQPMAGFSRSGIQLMVTDHFDYHYLPHASDQKARWALAFFREGLSIRLGGAEGLD
jgi:hypothetical protein